MFKILIESHVPFAEGAFGGEAEVAVLAPGEFTRQRLTDEKADAIIVRTRTRCDASLLEGTGVSVVATATIGTDHIDIPYCESRGIKVVNAPGCNAPAVAQYVFAAALRLIGGRHPSNLTLGIVGVGNVGSIVARWGRQLGFRVLECDPPRELCEPGYRSVPLETIAAEADIITFHTPHTRTGAHATHHLADERFFSSLRRKPMIINAARGPIVDTAALLAAIADSKVGDIVTDCWEGEPLISRELLTASRFATPHIAGYSIEGKKRATQMTVNAVLRHFGSDRRLDLGIPPGAAAKVTAGSITASYDPAADTEVLRSAYAAVGDDHEAAKAFEHLRDSYPLRREVR